MTMLLVFSICYCNSIMLINQTISIESVIGSRFILGSFGESDRLSYITVQRILALVVGDL
jgi:hypothetical protein